MPIIEPEFMELTKDLDVAAFWEEEHACVGFTTDKPRCAIEFLPDDHWLFEFLSVPSTLAYYRDKTCRDRLHAEGNALTQEHVGIKFFEEDTWEYSPKRIENLFGSEFKYTEGGTPWLQHVATEPDVLSEALDRAEATDLETWALPEAYRREWDERKARGLTMPKLGGGSRGPATIMTSIVAPDVLLYWAFDHPDLLARFSDVLARKMIELNRVLREFSGNDQPGWWITDDNCALFSPDLYHQFCYPVLDLVLAEFAPGDALRYQHSDSAMAHLLDQQRELGINQVNYGPTIDVALIREKMTDAMILGHLPPFLLRNGAPEEIKDRIIDDFAKAGGTGGMKVVTAGSLAAGTGVGRMRWFMQVVQEHCRYDG